MNEDAATKVPWNLAPIPVDITEVTVVHADFQGETATYGCIKKPAGDILLPVLQSVCKISQFV